MRKALSLEMLLRDGKHPRTTNGNTYGATDWLEREIQRMDTTVLDARLAAIAERVNVLEPLKSHGIGIKIDEGP